MTDKMKNILIGLFVTCAVTIMIAMVLFLEPRIGDGKKALQVRFANISGIVIGTRVTFAGRPVGEVIAIREVKEARQEATDETGKVYCYQLTLKLDSSVDVYNTDEVAIRTTGLMGEKSIAILPKVPPKDKASHLVTNQVLYANSVDPLENTFSQITRTSTRLEGAIQRFDQWFSSNSETLTRSLEKLDSVLGAGETLLSSANRTEIVPHMRESVDLLNDNLRSLKISLEEDRLLQKMGNLTESLTQASDAFNHDGARTLAHLHQITRDIASGSGTVGRLISGEDFYLRLGSLMSKGETLMNDINHYGLLFQYDKHWQRSRTRKANLLKALDSPREFRDFFEGEVDTMTTSLGRLTELLEKAQGEREKMIESDQFRKQFSHLLRSVQSLSDSLKLYNEGLITQSTLE